MQIPALIYSTGTVAVRRRTSIGVCQRLPANERTAFRRNDRVSANPPYNHLQAVIVTQKWPLR